MKILITNDDGIGAPALPHLVRWAKKLGEVTVVAPKTEQSGRSQAIDFYREIEIKPYSLPEECEAWAVASTPADCVRFAVLGLHKQYDLVLSGINRGYNLGHDIVYSGTVGAIFEGARLGIPGIALSTEADVFEPVLAELDGVYDYITKKGLMNHANLLNVNIPPKKSRGICITMQGGAFFHDAFIHRGNDMYAQIGDFKYGDGEDLSQDLHAVRDGYISISPLTEKRTDWSAYEKLKNL